MTDKKKNDKREGGATLESGTHGLLQISDPVVESIAGIAAREVEGVFELGRGGLSRVAKAFSSDNPGRGVRVEVGKTEVAIDLALVVSYGHSIQEVCNNVRKSITERIAQMTGLKVKELNLTVVDIHFPEEPKPQPEPRVR